MTQIKISIDCDGKYCGDCHKLHGIHCMEFEDDSGGSVELDIDYEDIGSAFTPLKYYRCPQCLAATVEE